MLSAKNEKFRVNWISPMNKILHFARIKFSGRFLKLRNPQNPGKLVLLRYKVSVKMSERFDDFFGISESWRAFDESRFNVSFSISDFEILLNLKYLFLFLLFIATMLGWILYCSDDLVIGSSIWLIFPDLSYFGILRGCLHEISFWAKWNIFISVSAQSLVTVYMYIPKSNSLRVLFNCSHFGRNEISFRVIKYHVKWNHMKGNIYTCIVKNDWLLLNGPFILDDPETKFISFCPQCKVM